MGGAAVYAEWLSSVLGSTTYYRKTAITRNTGVDTLMRVARDLDELIFLDTVMGYSGATLRIFTDKGYLNSTLGDLSVAGTLKMLNIPDVYRSDILGSCGDLLQSDFEFTSDFTAGISGVGEETTLQDIMPYNTHFEDDVDDEDNYDEEDPEEESIFADSDEDDYDEEDEEDEESDEDYIFADGGNEEDDYDEYDEEDDSEDAEDEDSIFYDYDGEDDYDDDYYEGDPEEVEEEDSFFEDSDEDDDMYEEDGSLYEEDEEDSLFADSDMEDEDDYDEDGFASDVEDDEEYSVFDNGIYDDLDEDDEITETREGFQEHTSQLEGQQDVFGVFGDRREEKGSFVTHTHDAGIPLKEAQNTVRTQDDALAGAIVNASEKLLALPTKLFKTK